ncbi:hypothetical protein VTN02DRAFT_2007 [Thermoascus thermophilus]
MTVNGVDRRQDVSLGASGFERNIQALSDIPLAILRAELLRRAEAEDGDADGNDRPTCGSTKRGSYNTPLHVIAIFLIFGLSILACSFPVIARRFPRLPIPRRFLFLSRHFGTGVLIATAFIHLLPTAFVSLTDPCLPRFWNKGYPAMAGLVAMLAVFVVVTVEMLFAMKGAGHVHGSEYDNLILNAEGGSMDEDRHREGEYSQLGEQGGPNTIRLGNMRDIGHLRTKSHDMGASSENLINGSGTGSAESPDENKDDDLDLEELDPYTDRETYPSAGRQEHPPSRPRGRRRSHGHGEHRRTKSDVLLQNPQKQLLQCLLLEAGILFHSIFIGMALSVATGTSFVVLLVAISFHQTFEGFALGSRIASLIPDLFSTSSAKPWLMSLAYGTTTPIGQVIGLVLHNLYDPASTVGLLMVGLTNAFSSGLLLFAGLVELLAEDFLSDSSYETLRGRRRFEACVAVACGAMLMALVGAFA